MAGGGETFHFSVFCLDTRRRVLLANGVPVPVSFRGLDLLALLVRGADRVLSKDEIVAAVWEGRVVSDNNLTVQMSSLRKLLADHAGGEQLIVTLPGRGYRFVGDVRLDSDEARPDFSPPARAPARGRILAAGMVALLLVAGVLAARSWMRARPVASPAPPRMSLAVLPFRNLSGIAAQDYLADAITDDLSGELAHIPGSLVIAQESANSFKGRGVPVQEIGRALNVRYLLEGTLRAEDNQYHINAELVDAASGAYLWSGSFDETKARISEARDAIVRRLSGALDFQLDQIASSRSLHDRPDDADALDLFFRARAILDWDDSLAGYDRAQALLEQAVAKEPEFGDALAELGRVLVRKVVGTDDPQDVHDWAEAKTVIAKALHVAPHNSWALATQARVLRIDGRCGEATYNARAALSYAPSNLDALSVLATCATDQGSVAEAERLQEAILRLSPDSPSNKPRLLLLGELRLLDGHVSEAIDSLRRSIAGDPEPLVGADSMGRPETARILLIAALMMNGEIDAAKSMYAEYAMIWPHRSVWRFSRYFQKRLASLPAQARILEALRQAGMPLYADEHEGATMTGATCPDGDFSPTPVSLPGGRVLDTEAVTALLKTHPAPLVLDVSRGTGALPGTTWLDPAGTETPNQFVDGAVKQRAAAGGGFQIIVVGDGPFGCEAFQAARHLVAAGFHDVAWYRGGEEAWARAGGPSRDLRPD